jgi:hypothetical protein
MYKWIISKPKSAFSVHLNSSHTTTFKGTEWKVLRYNAMNVVKQILYIIMLWEVTYVLISTEHANADRRFFRNVGSI